MVKDLGTHYEVTYETEGSTGKKWGVGLASFFIEGLGQVINGQWGKGALFFLSALGTQLGAYILPAAGKFGAGMLCGLASLGIKIWATADAVKNAKGEIKTLIPKEQTNFDIQG